MAGASCLMSGSSLPRQDTSCAQLLFDKIEVIGNLPLPPQCMQETWRSWRSGGKIRARIVPRGRSGCRYVQEVTEHLTRQMFQCELDTKLIGPRSRLGLSRDTHGPEDQLNTTNI